jgi:hypothetical protein
MYLGNHNQLDGRWSKYGRVNRLSEALRILAVAWGLKGLVEREGDITGDGEVVEGGIDEGLVGLNE